MHTKLRLPIASITPFTFQDYPNHNAAIFWFMGCNMKCSYCHNPDLVLGRYNVIPLDKIMKFLQARQGLLDAIVLSGGECTLVKDIFGFVNIIKSLGFKVKIDTNGCSPDVIKKLIKDDLIDYVALDFKGTKEKFKNITNLNGFELFKKTLNILKASKIDWEIRTTFHPDFLNTKDIQEMVKLLCDNGIENPLILQRVRAGNNLGNKEFRNFTYSEFGDVLDNKHLSFR